MRKEKNIKKEWSNKTKTTVIITVLMLVVTSVLVVASQTPIYSKPETLTSLGEIGENSTSIGWELLDNDTVFHMWNRHDSYYFNATNGVQFSNHHQEYWTKNVLMLGYYAGDQWNLLYRTDELSGFNRIFDNQNEYINITLWKDLSYASYDFRLERLAN